MTSTLATTRFPGESKEYRAARDRLSRAETELRGKLEEVAALRRKLPLGGPVKEDYAFEEAEAGPGARVTVKQTRLSELFGTGRDTLILYNFMYGPDMPRPCPLCTSILDGLDGSAPHVTSRVSLGIVAKSAIQRIRDFARERGWRHLRLLSSAHNSYNADYHGETHLGEQLPTLNVFVRRNGRVHHFYNTELLYGPRPRGMDPRHVDLIWPVWNLLDLTPGGRGTDWYPSLDEK
jgi:predicted dithiol-disulfide oxidoreductase (DUF899 family)